MRIPAIISLIVFTALSIPVFAGASANLIELSAGKEGRFEAGDISIEPKDTVYHFRRGGQDVLALNSDGQYPFLGPVWTADLDANGLGDFVVYASHMGNGISPDEGIVLFQAAPGEFRRVDVTTYELDSGDFRDLDKDGKPELILRSLTGQDSLDGKLHSFWVEAAYKIDGYSLKRMEFGQGAFPKFVWFTNKPNDKETTKLSAEQKHSYYATLPEVLQAR